MTDIVERLRDRALWMNDLGYQDEAALQDEAADEIENLRAALDRCRRKMEAP